MDKFNELNLQAGVKLEDILTTAFLQITDPNQLEGSGITTSAKPERNDIHEPLPANRVDNLFNDQTLALEVAGGISTSSSLQETITVAFKDFIPPAFQEDDVPLLFEHEIPTCLDSSGTSGPFSSDTSNKVFYTPELSQIDINVEDTSECLVAFDTIPEALVDNTNDVAVPCFYDQDVHIGDILVDFSLVEKDISLGNEDLETSPLDIGLLVSVRTSPSRELQTVCSDVDEIDSFELSPSFIALLPSPISSKMLLELEEDAACWHLPNMTRVVHPSLVDNLDRTHRPNIDHREETADDRPLDVQLFLRHIAESPNCANTPAVAPPAVYPRRQTHQNGCRRGRLLEPRDSSQNLSTEFPATNSCFEPIPIYKKCEKGKANPRSKKNQPNAIPKLFITTSRSSGSDLPNPGPTSEPFNFGSERQAQDEKGNSCWSKGLVTEFDRLHHYSTPPVVDNHHPHNISVSLVNANASAHPSTSTSWRRVSKSHSEIEQSTILPRAGTYSLKNGHTNLKDMSPPLLASTSSLPLSKDSSDVKKKNSEYSLLQDFWPGYEDCPIYSPRSPTLDHIPPRINLPSKQCKAVDSSFAFSGTKNGVPRRMHSNIPVSTINKWHGSGSTENRFDKKKNEMSTQVNRNQQFTIFTEQSQVLHNPFRTLNPDFTSLPTLKASQGQPRAGRKGLQQKPTKVARGLGFITPETTSSRNQDQFARPFLEVGTVDDLRLSDLPIAQHAMGFSDRSQSVHATRDTDDKRDRVRLASGPHNVVSFDERRTSNIGHSSRPDRFTHIYPVLRGGRVIGLRAKKDDRKLKPDDLGANAES